MQQPIHYVTCPKLPEFKWDDLASVQKAFASIPAISMQQSWRPELEPDFAPAAVRAGWRDETLHVFAELTDADIFTHAMRNNERLWEKGDVFEIFLRPEVQSTYFEFHVAPNNIQLQLRFPDAQAVLQHQPEHFMVASPQLFASAAWIEAGEKRWRVSAKIPAASVCEKNVPMAGTKWHFSFSRYDYTHGREKPVISSTSPHVVSRFHRQEEWGTLQFAP